MGTFTFEGRAVSYLDEGAGEQAVLLVHGFPFAASMWEPQIPVAVEAGRRAVAPDLPGFGGSDVPADRSAYSIEGYADLVAALIADLGLGRVVLVGLSMGGYIALAVARRHPEVLAEGSPRHEEAAARLGQMMRSTAPAGWVGALEAMKQRSDQTDLLPQVSVPVLVVVGESDALVPLDVAEAMAKAIPGARFEVVPGAGHVSNLENPEVFNRALSDFLEALPAAGPAA